MNFPNIPNNLTNDSKTEARQRNGRGIGVWLKWARSKHSRRSIWRVDQTAIIQFYRNRSRWSYALNTTLSLSNSQTAAIKSLTSLLLSPSNLPYFFFFFLVKISLSLLFLPPSLLLSKTPTFSLYTYTHLHLPTYISLFF